MKTNLGTKAGSESPLILAASGARYELCKMLVEKKAWEMMGFELVDWIVGHRDIAICQLLPKNKIISSVFRCIRYYDVLWCVNPRISYMTFRPSNCLKGSIVCSRFRRRGDGDSSFFETFEAKSWNARFLCFL